MGRKEKKEKGKSRFGAFFGGGFIGFNLCLALIVGLVAFVYFKVSPSWINKTFKTNIDLGSETANNMTIENFVLSAISLKNNFDNYKLSSLESDFGIKLDDKLYGIDISDLKDVELAKLGEALGNKLSSISAGELKNISGMDLEESMGSILDKSNTYYYNNNKLYKDMACLNEVDFDYVLSADKTKVAIKNKQHSIVSGEVKVTLWDLPLTSAFGDFISSMGDNLTLEDLENDYGVTLPSFLDRVDKKNTTVNELESAINSLYVADFLGYTIDKSDPDNIIVWDGSSKVTGVLATLSQYTINRLEEGVKDLTLADLFSEDERTGVLSLIDNPEKVTLTGETDTNEGILSISDAFAKVVEEKTIGQLADAGLISYEGFEDMRTKWIDTDLTPTGTNYVQVQDLTLNELLDISITILDEGGLLLDSQPTN